MTEAELVAIELTDEERELIVLALNEYAGTAQHTYRLLCPVLGQSSKHEWFQLINRLESALVGSGLRFGRAADEYWFEILRSLQGKVSTYPRFLLLLQNAGYPPAG